MTTTDTILHAVIRDAFDAANTPLEAHVDSLYLDTKGLETTATGILCDSPVTARAFAWLNADGSPATAIQVVAEWHRVKAMRPGLIWTRYRIPTGLHLAPAEIGRIVLERLDADGEILNRRWRLADLPPQAVAALLMLAWAVGAGKQASGLTGRTWPHLAAAVDARDWAGAAVAGQLRWEDNPGVRPRDLVVASLFWMADGLDGAAAKARAGIVGGPGRPSDAAALASLAAFDWDGAAETLRPVTMAPPAGE